MSTALDDIGALMEDVAVFDSDTELAGFFDSTCRGIDSDLTNHARVAEWADRVRLQLPAADGAGNYLRGLLLEGPQAQIESLRATTENPAFMELKKAQFRANNLGIGAQAKAAHLQSQQSVLVEEILDRVRLRPDLKLSSCHQLAADLTEMYKLRDGLATSKIASNVLGDRFQQHETTTIELAASAKHVRAVFDASIPIEVRDWLLQSSGVDRLAALRPVAAQAAKAAVEVEAAANDLAQVVSVDFGRWLGATSVLDTDASELKEHAARCSEDPEGFQALIDDARSMHEACEAGLKPLLDLFETQQVPLHELGNATRRVIYQSVSRLVIASSPALANFSGDRYEGNRKEFRELDHKLKRLRQARIANDLASRPVDPGTKPGKRSAWTGRALIQNGNL